MNQVYVHWEQRDCLGQSLRRIYPIASSARSSSDCVRRRRNHGPTRTRITSCRIRLRRLGLPRCLGGVDAAPAPAAGVARILARTHLGMATAKRGHLPLKRDRCDRPILSAAGGEPHRTRDWESKRRSQSVSYGGPAHRCYGAQAHHHQKGVAKRISSHFAFEERPQRLVLNHRLYRVLRRAL